MIRKLLIVMLVLVFVAPALALEDFQYDKSKVVVGVELSSVEKDIDNLNILNIGVGSIDGSLTLVNDDLGLTTALVKLGYQISEQATPYVLLGAAKLSFDQRLDGSLKIGASTLGARLLATEYRETNLAVGLGMEGDLLQVKGVKLSYDARWLRTTGKETDERLEILPDFTSISLANKLEVEYNEVSLAAILSKEIDLEDKESDRKAIVKSVTPFVGYQVALVNMNIEGSAYIGPVTIANESNYEGVNHSALFGVVAKVNDNVSVKVAGVAGNETGFNVAMLYRF